MYIVTTKIFKSLKPQAALFASKSKAETQNKILGRDTLTLHV